MNKHCLPYLSTVRTTVFLLLLLILSACSKNEPDNLPPTVTVLPATDISRISATLHGVVTSNGGTITRIQFRYGQTLELEHTAHVAPTPGSVSTIIDGLQHGTVYYFRLEAGDDISLISSPVLDFTTERRTDTVIHHK